jgi:hypothetical protein
MQGRMAADGARPQAEDSLLDDEEVSHAGYPVFMVREKENMPTLKSS